MFRLVWLTCIWLWLDNPYHFATVKMISKKFHRILDVTANTRACCLGNHLGMSQVSLDTLVKNNLWKRTEKCRGCCWCRRPRYGTYMCASCGALMLGGVPSVALTCSGFDIAYSYWCVKGRASWNPSPATWELLGVADAANILIKHSVTVIWTFRSTEHMLSSKCEKIEPSQYNPAAPPAQGTPLQQKSAIIFAACIRASFRAPVWMTSSYSNRCRSLVFSPPVLEQHDHASPVFVRYIAQRRLRCCGCKIEQEKSVFVCACTFANKIK